ncbi:hypothetical protein LWI29_016286 [Acer saccharum]|uniref:Uncharacterized protein n=1 Tax=Acer saccharum TaxID=4024 RepID=A0AA39TSQ1_ACESA|nr:hypothetical protein LWI29_016286 [Acer saccharum]
MIVSVDCGQYTSGDEIVHSVRYACKQKLDEIQAVDADKASDGVNNGVEKVEKINSLTMPEVGEFCKDRLDGSRALKASNDSSCLIEGIKGSCDDKDEAEASKAFRIGNGVSSKELNRKRRCRGEHPVMNSVDIEKHIYMSVALAPDLDILIQSSGETCIAACILQRNHSYL